MKQRTFGSTVAALRRERGMTQLELAEQMGVTDKAVSKWERELSLPDTASIPRLAEVLGVSVEELMGVHRQEEAPLRERAAGMGRLVLRGIAAAMGIAVAVLVWLDQADGRSALAMLGIGLACLAVSQLGDEA